MFGFEIQDFFQMKVECTSGKGVFCFVRKLFLTNRALFLEVCFWGPKGWGIFGLYTIWIMKRLTITNSRHLLKSSGFGAQRFG